MTSRRNSDPVVQPSITINTPNYSSSILQKLNEHRLQKTFTDITIVADGEEFVCHRNVLSASSEYFQALFAGDFKESSAQKISIGEVSAKTLQTVIDYAYSGTLDINIDNAQDLLAAGSLFQYEEMFEASCDFLLSHLHPSNCLGIEQYAHLYSCDRLESEAHQCALDNFSTVVSHEEFLEIPMIRLVSYLASEMIDVRSEQCVYKAAYGWLYHDISKRKQYACEINKHLRFAMMDIEFLQSKALKEELISGCSQCKELVASQMHDSKANGSVEKSSDGNIAYVPRMSTVSREVLVVLGGMTETNEILQSVEMFDASKGKWTAFPNMPLPVSFFSVTAVTNVIYVTGGILGRHMVNNVWKFSAASDLWEMEAPLLSPRARHVSVTHSSKIFTLGGITVDKGGGIDSVRLLDTIECFDPLTHQWTQVGKCPFPRKQSRIVPYLNTLVEVGGTQHDHYIKHDIMESFIVSKDGDVTHSGEQYRLPQTVNFAQVAVVDDIFYIISEDKCSMIMLNPAKRTFRQMAAPSYLHVHSGAAIVDSNIYLTGGVADTKPTRTVECYNTKLDVWTCVKSMTTSRAFHGCVTVTLP